VGLSRAEVARLYNLSERYFYKLVDSGRVPAPKTRGCTLHFYSPLELAKVKQCLEGIRHENDN
jgi:excisionase family DNA binding protein